MAPKGRPALTEDVLRKRIADYCARYGVTQLSSAGFPAYPAGRRETRQHREWVVLYKALSRLARRKRNEQAAEREPILRFQRGRCPICLKRIDASDEGDLTPGPGGSRALVHSLCNELLRIVAELGPAVLDRVRAFLPPTRSGPAQDGTTG